MRFLVWNISPEFNYDVSKGRQLLNPAVLITFSGGNMRRKLKKFAKDYHAGLISIDKAQKSYDGWRAHALYGNTHSLIRDMDQYYEQLFGEPFIKHKAH